MKKSKTMKSVVKEMLDKLKLEADSFLIPLISSSLIVPRLLAYRDVFAPNFVPWMANVWVKCQSKVAQKACQDNLLCEIKEDHPAMLRRYAAQAEDPSKHYSLAAQHIFVHLIPTIHAITRLTQKSVIDGLLIMAALENTSVVFIPEMKQWGKMLNFTDFEYVNKHGKADKKHANEFRRAVETEAELLGVHAERLANHPTLFFVKTLLRRLFGSTHE